MAKTIDMEDGFISNTIMERQRQRQKQRDHEMRQQAKDYYKKHGSLTRIIRKHSRQEKAYQSRLWREDEKGGF